MLTIIHTKDGTLLDGVQVRGSMRFDGDGLTYHSYQGLVKKIPWNELLEIKVSDIQGEPTMYQVKDRVSADWTTQKDDLITLKVKNKYLRKLLTLLFKVFHNA